MQVVLNRIDQDVNQYFGNELESKFEYNVKGKYPFIQKICFWILKKLECQIKDTEIKYTRTAINLDSLFDAVLENKVMMRMIYNREAKYLIVGNDYYEKFMKEIAKSENDFIYFNVPYEYKSKVFYNGVREEGIFRGLKVIFVPYLEGIFCLPDLNQHSTY